MTTHPRLNRDRSIGQRDCSETRAKTPAQKVELSVYPIFGASFLPRSQSALHQTRPGTQHHVLQGLVGVAVPQGSERHVVARRARPLCIVGGGDESERYQASVHGPHSLGL